MAKDIQFGDFAGRGRAAAEANPHCAACEAMLTDAVDGTLGAAEQGWFDRHIAGCVTCSEMLADAQRGSAWLELLKSTRPEPGAELMQRILAETSGYAGQASQGVEPVADVYEFPAMGAGTVPLLPQGTVAGGNVVPFQPGFVPAAVIQRSARQSFGRVLLEPRLAMTAAMAFFSIALTMNLTGVRLNQLHASDLKPSAVRRSYFQARAKSVQYYDNLRVVHVLESRVDDLRQANEDREQRQRSSDPQEVTPQNGPRQDKQPQERQEERQERRPKSEPGAGTSRRDTPAEGQRGSQGETTLAAMWPWNLAGGPA